MALAVAGVLGFANHRGSTCLVAAVAEPFHARRATRLLVLAEASLWALVAGSVGSGAGFGMAAPAPPSLGLAVLAGGVLLGLGAWLNDACIFGTVARIGSRNFHYLLTPLGFYLGLLAFANAGLMARGAAGASGATPSPVAAAVALVAILGHWLVTARRGNRIATPYRAATLAIVGCHLVLTRLVGAWSYTEALARLADGRMVEVAASTGLFAGVLAGALAGGWGRSAIATFSTARALRCLAGGGLMGVGAALVPGGNDTLLLQGAPGLQPFALLALAVMVATIAACITASRAVRAASARAR